MPSPIPTENHLTRHLFNLKNNLEFFVLIAVYQRKKLRKQAKRGRVPTNLASIQSATLFKIHY